MNSIRNDLHAMFHWSIITKQPEDYAFQMKVGIAIGLIVLALSQHILRKGNALVEAPFVGSSQAWLARISFLTGATKSVFIGYAEVGPLIACGS